MCLGIYRNSKRQRGYFGGRWRRRDGPTRRGDPRTSRAAILQGLRVYLNMVNGYLRILPPPIWDAGYNPVFSPFSASNIPPTSVLSASATTTPLLVADHSDQHPLVVATHCPRPPSGADTGATRPTQPTLRIRSSRARTANGEPSRLTSAATGTLPRAVQHASPTQSSLRVENEGFGFETLPY